MKPITFDIPFRAVPKGNKQKVAKRGAHGRMIKGDLTGVLKKTEEEFAELVRNRLSEDQLEDLPWDCPFKAVVRFQYEVPSSYKGWKLASALRKPTFESSDEKIWYYVNSPDLDNIEKWLWDSLEGLIFKNDARLVRKVVDKTWGGEDRIFVELIPLRQARKP